MLIVTSGLADAHLWAEVLNLGGYDVLAKPFDDQEVQRVVAGAWRQQQNRSEFALMGDNSAAPPAS
jgi:FixJ family two-component response regulator